MAINDLLGKVPKQALDKAKAYRTKIAGWGNAVEFVNNMYGCHPGDEGEDYFRAIYK